MAVLPSGWASTTNKLDDRTISCTCLEFIEPPTSDQIWIGRWVQLRLWRDQTTAFIGYVLLRIWIRRP
jgi:hypothetical protein